MGSLSRPSSFPSTSNEEVGTFDVKSITEIKAEKQQELKASELRKFEEEQLRITDRKNSIQEYLKNSFENDEFSEESIQEITEELFTQEEVFKSRLNKEIDIFDHINQNFIKKRLEKKNNKGEDKSADVVKEKTKSNTEIITILLQQHNDKEITLSAENYETLKQWQSLLSEPLIPAEIRNSLPQKINDGGVNIFDAEAFSQFVTSEVFASDKIDDVQKEKIAEKLKIPYLRTGSDLKGFAEKYKKHREENPDAKENTGEYFEFRGKQVRATESGKLEIKVGENKTFAIAPGIEGEEIGERVNYSLVSNLLDKYKLQKFMPERIKANGFTDAGEELPVQDIRRTNVILALICPEHRRGEIISQGNLNKINQSMRMFRENPDLMTGGISGGTTDLKKLGILDETGNIVEDKFLKSLMYAGTYPRDKFSDLKRHLDGKKENEVSDDEKPKDEKPVPDGEKSREMIA